MLLPRSRRLAPLHCLLRWSGGCRVGRLRGTLPQRLILTSLGAGTQRRADLTWAGVTSVPWRGRPGFLARGRGSSGGPLHLDGRRCSLLWPPGSSFCSLPSGAPVTPLTLERPSEPQGPDHLQLCATPHFRHKWARVHTLTFSSLWPSRTLALPGLTQVVRTPVSLARPSDQLL